MQRHDEPGRGPRTIPLIRALWTGAPTYHRGQHYEVAGAYCEPRPDPVPTVMVGGHGEKYLLRVVAEHADWWNLSFRGHDVYAQKQAALQRHCKDVGRDYDAIVQVVRVGILIAETEAEILRLRALPWVRPDVRVIGTPPQVTEILRQIVAQGAHRLTVHFPEGTWLFAAAVLPHL